MNITRRNAIVGAASATIATTGVVMGIDPAHAMDPSVDVLQVNVSSGKRDGLLRSKDGGQTWFVWCPCMAHGDPVCDAWNVLSDHE